MNHGDMAARFIDSLVQASAPALSPDGTQVAFVVTQPMTATNLTRSQVWLAPVGASRAPRPITSGDEGHTPAWSPDGRSLAYVTKGATKGEVAVRLIPIDAPGETVTLATFADGASQLSFSPDGRWLAVSSRTRHERYSTPDESWQAPRKIERFFTRLDDEGWVYDRPQHVYVVRTDGTEPPRNLTPGDFQFAAFSWLADSTGLVVAAAAHDTWDLDFAHDLYRIGLDGVRHALTAHTGIYHLPSVSPDGSVVAFLGSDDPSTSPQNKHVAVIAPTGGGHRFVSRGLDRTFECTAGEREPVWDSVDSMLAMAEDAGETHLWRVHVDGRHPERLTSGPITVKGFDHAAGTTVVVAGCVDGLADVYVLRDGALERLTDFTDRFRATVSPQGWQRLQVPTTDGTGHIDAWIMRPAGFDPAQRYPVLLNVHGGPHTQYGETMFDEAQMQAAAGFVVVMCNPRGSSGREEAWGQAILGPRHHVRPGSGWGGVDVDDVLAVLDHVLATFGFCDPQRVGMLGGSYGGFMATWLAARHGERFRAICSERAVNNMLSEEWTSDIGSIFRTEVGTTHLDDPAAYEAFSPVRWVRDIHVPMLLIHSENDLRCPIGQAEELFMALRLLGRDVTFYRFPGESHELSRSGSPVHRTQRATIILDWFTEHLAPR